MTDTIQNVEVGDRVISFDFPKYNRLKILGTPKTPNAGCFVVGIVEGIDTEGWDCPRYKIRCTSRVFGGKVSEEDVGRHYFPPVNGTPTFGRRFTDNVEKYEEFLIGEKVRHELDGSVGRVIGIERQLDEPALYEISWETDGGSIINWMTEDLLAYVGEFQKGEKISLGGETVIVSHKCPVQDFNQDWVVQVQHPDGSRTWEYEYAVKGGV